MGRNSSRIKGKDIQGLMRSSVMTNSIDSIPPSPEASNRTMIVSSGVCSWTLQFIEPNSQVVHESGVVQCRSCKSLYLLKYLQDSKCFRCDSTNFLTVRVEAKPSGSIPNRIACHPLQSNVGLIEKKPIGLSQNTVYVTPSGDGLTLRNNSIHNLTVEVRWLPPELNCDAFWFDSPREFGPNQEMTIRFWQDFFIPGPINAITDLYIFKSSHYDHRLFPKDSTKIYAVQITTISNEKSGVGKVAFSISLGLYLLSVPFLGNAFMGTSAVSNFLLFVTLFSAASFLSWLIQPGYGRNWVTKIWKSSKDTTQQKNVNEIADLYSLSGAVDVGIVMRLIFFPLYWLTITIVTGIPLLIARSTGFNSWYIVTSAFLFAYLFLVSWLLYVSYGTIVRRLYFFLKSRLNGQPPLQP